MHNKALHVHNIIKTIFCIIILAYCSSCLALHPSETKYNITLEEAAKLGIQITVSEDGDVVPSEGCNLIEIELPEELSSRTFRFVSAYFYNKNDYAAGLDLVSVKSEKDVFSSMLEICKRAITKVRLKIGYGSAPNDKILMLSITP